MSKESRYRIAFGTLSPLTTLASGAGDTLDWFGTQFFIMVAFIIIVLIAKINWIGKGIMTVIFIVAEYLTVKLSVGPPYSDYKLLIEIVSAIVPIATTSMSYWILKSKFEKG
ncbi:MAG: hypothetical protein QM762_04555 [Chryseolinea sp.]